MKKIFVINESPSDVFSKHLLGKESLEIVRLRFQDSRNLPKGEKLILTVNEKISTAEFLKSHHYDAKVMAVYGGEKDFQPAVTIVYGRNEHDYHSYGSWQEFDQLVFGDTTRKNSVLKFKEEFPEGGIYEPNIFLLPSHHCLNPESLQNLILNSISLSKKYFLWLQEWLLKAYNGGILVNLQRKGKVNRFQAEFRNELDGLPILNVGDSVCLFKEDGSPLHFKREDNESVSANVAESDAFGATIKLSSPVSGRLLSLVHRLRPDNSLADLRLKIMSHRIHRFDELLYQDEELAYAPMSFLRSVVLFPWSPRHLRYPKQVFLSEATRKILRDESQLAALMDMLSDSPLSLVIGPAGTGKTLVSAVGVDNFLRRGCQVLLVSHSNLAVDNLLLEVANYVNHDRIFRIGNNTSVMSETARKFWRNLPLRDLQMYDDDVSGWQYNSISRQHRGIVIAGTIDGFLTSRLFRDGNYHPDVVFIDEASRGLYPEIFPLFAITRSKVIMIGDNRQLGGIPFPAALLDCLAEEKSEKLAYQFERGFFNALVDDSCLAWTMLRHNRRSLPKISELVSQVFYEGGLFVGRFNPNKTGEVIFLDTEKLEATEAREGVSWQNPVEVGHLVRRFIAQAIKQVKAGGKIEDVVIITPYLAQVRLLKKKLRNQLLFHTAFSDITTPENIDGILDKIVITVDSIQGGQRKIVFVSLVRSNTRQEIGFNKDIRRLNVAMSRAQEVLIIIGNSKTFTQCDSEEISSSFRHLINLVKRDKKYFLLK